MVDTNLGTKCVDEAVTAFLDLSVSDRVLNGVSDDGKMSPFRRARFCHLQYGHCAHEQVQSALHPRVGIKTNVISILNSYLKI